MSVRSILGTILVSAGFLSPFVGIPPAHAADPPSEARGDAALTLTLPQAYALARRSSPSALSSRALVPEARGAMADARIFPRQNPVVEVAVGPRVTDTEVTPTVTIEAMQTVDLGGGPRARIRAVTAGVTKASAEGEARIQATQREVGLAFVRALWAERRLEAQAEIEGIAADTLRAAERRLKGGDASRLELSAARIALARARSQRIAVAAERDAAIGALHVLLGVPPATPIVVKGALDEEDPLALSSLQQRAKSRPDLRALGADLDAARAEIALGEALAAPQLGVGIRFEHEEGSVNTVLGVLSLSLPIFDHGQGISARARAVARRAETDVEQRRAQIPIEVRAAFDVYVRRLEAARALEREGAGSVEESLALAQRGFEEQELGLADLLTLRREILDARLELLDRWLDVRVAGVELQAAAGALP